MANNNVRNSAIKSPTKIPSKGWKKILIGIKDSFVENNVDIIAAGVAFFAFLAIFPAIIALVSIYGLAVDPSQIENQISALGNMMPDQALDIVKDQLESIIETGGQTLGWGMATGILFSLWSANAGTKSLFRGIDMAYGTKKSRNFFKQNGLTLLFTLGAIVLIIISMTLIVVFPAIVNLVDLPDNIQSLISWLRWPILALFVAGFLCLIYKYAPARIKKPQMKWVIPGALLATILWLLASWGFSYYVSNFGNYGEVYGSISAVVILMLWLFLTCFIILLGAELNSEMEKYAKSKDSF